MTQSEAFRQEERIADAVGRLAEFVHDRTWDRLPEQVRGRLVPVVTDLIGVTIAGLHTPELRAIIAAWHCPAGDAPVAGTGIRTTPETAAYLSAVAACALELDEGNKYAAGHPAAHVFFAATAAARCAGRPVSGREFLSAVALGYEVAARFGRATRRDPRWHTHGHWGATGAACAATLLLGGTPAQVAAAIDSASGLMHVTPWRTVLAGDATRNLWIAGANEAGLRAARLALAGVVHNRGALAYSLGDLVGALNPDDLIDDLGDRWLVAEGYLKRHSACSYTHAAADLVLSLRESGGWHPDEITSVRVAIHSLARPLFGRHPDGRLAAMFSLPFVVSAAAVSGRVDPASMEPGSQAFRDAERFSERVQVAVDDRLDQHLPQARCAVVTVELRDGTAVSLGQPNPIGDSDHFPLGPDEIDQLLRGLIGASDAARVRSVVSRLLLSDSVTRVLDELP